MAGLQVGLSAQLLFFGKSYRGAGINRYSQSLVRGLQETAANDPNSYTVFVGDRRIPPDFITSPRFRAIASRLPTVRPVVRILWEQLLQPVALTQHQIQAVHGLAYALPLAWPGASLVTIHDLSFLLFPEQFNASNRCYLSAITRWSARKASRVIAVSAQTRQDVIRLLGVPADRVSVVYNCLEPGYQRLDATTLAAFRQRHNLPERFILNVATLEPRKNQERLVRAFARLHQQYPGLRPVKLVLVGGRGWRYEAIFAAVEELGLQQEVIFPGFVPHDELPAWYASADLFVYPSLYEGFGLPPLEAMACGTPVIVSNTASLPEVVGDAGLSVAPDDTGQLTETMARLLLHPNSSENERLRQAGPLRADLFTRRKMADETRRLYGEVAWKIHRKD